MIYVCCVCVGMDMEGVIYVCCVCVGMDMEV